MPEYCEKPKAVERFLAEGDELVKRSTPAQRRNWGNRLNGCVDGYIKNFGILNDNFRNEFGVDPQAVLGMPKGTAREAERYYKYPRNPKPGDFKRSVDRAREAARHLIYR